MKADSHWNNIYLLFKVAFVFIIVLLLAYFFYICHTSSLLINTRESKTKGSVESLKLSLETYKNDMGYYPVTNDSRLVMNELTGYKSSPEVIDAVYATNDLWCGPYYEATKRYFKGSKMNEALIDPWDSPYCFDFSEAKPRIWSWGPNRKNEYGLGDDITSWDVPGKGPWKEPLSQVSIIVIILFVITGSFILIMKCVFRSKLKQL
jgi:hypothetical protein